jgi:prepilin-type processing-associated H-X9-DG protein
MGIYAQDYDERLPDFRCDRFSAAFASDTPYWHDHFCRGLFLSPGQISYAALLKPYLRSSQVAFCPADTERTSGGRDTTSYEYKMWLADGHSLGEVVHPSGMALMWEQWGYHVDDGHLSEYDRRTEMNVLFLDSHVRWKRLSDATTARYGSGPDLHGLYQERNAADPFYGMDFVP